MRLFQLLQGNLNMETGQVMAGMPGGVCGWSPTCCPGPLSRASAAGGWKMLIACSSLCHWRSLESLRSLFSRKCFHECRGHHGWGMPKCFFSLYLKEIAQSHCSMCPGQTSGKTLLVINAEYPAESYGWSVGHLQCSSRPQQGCR